MTVSSDSPDDLTMSRYSRCSVREVRAERELRHADDAVQRRANLVAHVGQELALRAVGGVGRILRAFPLHDLRLEGQVGAGDFLHARSQASAARCRSVMSVTIPVRRISLSGGIPDLKTAGTNPADLAVGPHDAILDVQACVRLP